MLLFTMEKNAKRHAKLKRFLIILFCAAAGLSLLVLMPILLSNAQPCVYDDMLLGTSRETVSASWTRVWQREHDSSIAVESVVYELWEQNDEQMAAVFQNGNLCDYLIRSRTDGSLRGSVEAEYKALPTWLRLRFGLKQNNTHGYDVGSGGSIDSWLTSDGKVVVWFDTAESWVHDAFSMENAAEYTLLLSLNTLIHLPYTLLMMV